MSERKPAAPTDWHEAFAALPLESPPPGGWARIAGTLAPRRPARRRMLPWAAAATVACLAAVPGLIALRAPPPNAPVAQAVIAHEAPSNGNDDPSNDPGISIDQAPIADVATGTATAVAGATAATPPPRASTSPREADQGAVAMERLYAESAHLEGLLGRIQGPRATNAGMEAATQQLAGTVGAIDTALADASLDAQGRQALWRERNALLEQMLTLELQHDLLSRQAIAPFDFAQIN